MTTTSKHKRAAATETLARWTVISIPGREEDGSDTEWFAYDRVNQESSEGFASRSEAAAFARSHNA